MSEGHHRGHVESFADFDASAAGGSFATEGAAVAVDRSDSDEAGNLLSTECAQFGKLRDQRGHGGGAKTRDRLDDARFRLGGFIHLDECMLVPHDGFQLAFVESNGLLDHSADVLVSGGGEAVFLLNKQFRDLPLPGGEITEFLLVGGQSRRGPGLHEIGEAGDDAGIDLIGFGELSGGSGEVSNLPRIDYGDGNLVVMERLNQPSFESAGGFEADHLDGRFLERAEQLAEPLGRIGNGLDLGRIGPGIVQFVLRDIDSECECDRLSHAKTLPC